MSNDIHISIKAEEILHFGTFAITNSMLATLVILVGLSLFALVYGPMISVNKTPGKFQLLLEWVYSSMEELTSSALGAQNVRKYLGLVLGLLCFIVLGSWIGLLPGILHIGINHMELVNGHEENVFIPLLRAPTTDLNATLALAIIAFAVVQYTGVATLGLWGYLSKFFVFNQGPMGFILGLFELLSEFTRLISYSFRLFGNIFAGEVLIVVLLSLSKFESTTPALEFINFIGIPFPALIIILEVFVAMIQAYVFVNLMTVFLAMAAEPAHHDGHQEEQAART